MKDKKIEKIRKRQSYNTWKLLMKFLNNKPTVREVIQKVHLIIDGYYGYHSETNSRYALESLRQLEKDFNLTGKMDFSKPIFRVFYEEATNSGYEKINISCFIDLTDAREYAKKLVRDLKAAAECSDDLESVRIEDVQNGEYVESWVNDQGRIEHYPLMKPYTQFIDGDLVDQQAG